MQLARAEGARQVFEKPGDIAAVVALVARDFGYGRDAAPLHLALPEGAVMSTVDPDAVAIVARNLIENALRHGGGAGVRVKLDDSGTLTVENGGAAIPPDRMAGLTDRFVRGGGGEGSGLGLAIVQTIAGRIGSDLTLLSPIPGRSDGFRAIIGLNPETSNVTDRTS